MNKFLLAGSAALLVAGCATIEIPAPNAHLARPEFENAQADASPRIHFNNGINSFSTDHRKWTAVLIERLEKLAPKEVLPGHKAALNITSIKCGGYYVEDCSLSVDVTLSNGVRRVFSTPTSFGYPAGTDAALTKAINEAARLISSDSETMTFLYGPAGDQKMKSNASKL